MSRKKIAKQIAITVCLALALVISACQTQTSSTINETNQTTTVESSSTTSQTPTATSAVEQLTLYSSFSNGQIDAAPWYQKWLEENLHVSIDSYDSSGTDSGQYIQALMASGTLPDIITFNKSEFATNAVKANQLLCLDDYKDQLPNLYGTNDFFKYAIDYSRATMSNYTGKLYLMPTSIGQNNSLIHDYVIRWDVYQKIGAPEINTLEDYLTVLKAMQDAYPETEDGLKTYGLSLFPSWDGRQMFLGMALAYMYTGTDNESWSLFEINPEGTGTPLFILDDSSQYKRAMKFYYQANQMGILDPDSATQTWDTIYEKWGQGRILFSFWSWGVSGFNVPANTDAEDFKGYACVLPKDAKLPISPDSYVGDTGWTIGIGASAASGSPEHLAAALKFLDFYYSFEGIQMTWLGPQGIVWDVDSNGYRYITDKGWKILEGSEEMPGGGKLGASSAVINAPSITLATENPLSEKKETLGYTYWKSVIERNSQTKLMENWRDTVGEYYTIVDYVKGKNLATKYTQAIRLMASPDEDMTMKMNNIGDVIKTASWKMIYAKSEAEFDSIWKQAQSDAENLGLADVVSWYNSTWTQALDLNKLYQP